MGSRNRTALVLSGGGSRGAYEIGIWKALQELGIEVDMVFGTSVGAINGAMICQGDLRLTEQLWQQMETDMVFDLDSADEKSKQQKNASAQPNTRRASHKNSRPNDELQKLEQPSGAELYKGKDLLKKFREMDIGGVPTEDVLAYAREILVNGGAGSSGLYGLLQTYIDEGKIRDCGIEYGLVTTELPSLEGRFLRLDEIPQGRLVDFILASASCFPAVQKCTIDGVQYIDGGYRDNLPLEMALESGASRIIAVDLEAAGVVRHDVIARAKREADEFHLLKSSVDLGNFLIFDRDNTVRIMRLGYLDALRHWGVYDGRRYTFEKGAFRDGDRAMFSDEKVSAWDMPSELPEVTALDLADSVAWCLQLDPCCVYSPESLLAAVSEKLVDGGKSVDEDESANSNPEKYAGSTKADVTDSGNSPTAKKFSGKSIWDIRELGFSGIRKLLSEYAEELAEEFEEKLFTEASEEGHFGSGLRLQFIRFIARSIRKDGEKSPFYHSGIRKACEDEFLAAMYLLEHDLV